MLVLNSLTSVCCAAFGIRVINKFLWRWNGITVKVNIPLITKVQTDSVRPFLKCIVQFKDATRILILSEGQTVPTVNPSKIPSLLTV